MKRNVYNICILPVAIYGLKNKLRKAQGALERRMLEISLRYQIKNEQKRRRTEIKDTIHRLATLKWQWVGHLAKADQNMD